MKHLKYVVLFSFLFALSTLQSAANDNNKATVNPQAKQQSAEVQNEKYNILNRDEFVDDTDTLAIPLDDSEIEDEEEVDRILKKNVFPLPHSEPAKK